MLGQSFGGFTAMTYLSIAPDGLREALHHRRPVADRPPGRRRLRRDLRPADRGEPRATSSATPDDRARVREILRRLDAEDVRLPSGDRLTARRFRQLGMWLGDSAGFELLHHVLELPFGSLGVPPRRRGRGCRSPATRSTPRSTSRRTPTACATRWSADAARCPTRSRDEGYFTAEHVFPWMWEDYAALRPHGAAAEHPRRPRLAARCTTPSSCAATRSRWPRRSTPTTSTSSAASPSETAAAIRGLRPWITNELRAQRAARRRRARARPADRPGPRTGLTTVRPHRSEPHRPALGRTATGSGDFRTTPHHTPLTELGDVRNGRRPGASGSRFAMASTSSSRGLRRSSGSSNRCSHRLVRCRSGPGRCSSACSPSASLPPPAWRSRRRRPAMTRRHRSSRRPSPRPPRPSSRRRIRRSRRWSWGPSG